MSEIEVDIMGIIDAVQVVARFNKPLQELVGNFETYAPDAIRVRSTVRNAVSDGSGVYEALDRASPGLATAIHDFVYMVACPLQSITTRDLACEEVAKVVLAL